MKRRTLASGSAMVTSAIPWRWWSNPYQIFIYKARRRDIGLRVRVTTGDERDSHCHERDTVERERDCALQSRATPLQGRDTRLCGRDDGERDLRLATSGCVTVRCDLLLLSRS